VGVIAPFCARPGHPETTLRQGGGGREWAAPVGIFAVFPVCLSACPVHLLRPVACSPAAPVHLFACSPACLLRPVKCLQRHKKSLSKALKGAVTPLCHVSCSNLAQCEQPPQQQQRAHSCSEKKISEKKFHLHDELNDK